MSDYFSAQGTQSVTHWLMPSSIRSASTGCGPQPYFSHDLRLHLMIHMMLEVVQEGQHPKLANSRHSFGEKGESVSATVHPGSVVPHIAQQQDMPQSCFCCYLLCDSWCSGSVSYPEPSGSECCLQPGVCFQKALVSNLHGLTHSVAWLQLCMLATMLLGIVPQAVLSLCSLIV